MNAVKLVREMSGDLIDLCQNTHAKKNASLGDHNFFSIYPRMLCFGYKVDE